MTTDVRVVATALPVHEPAGRTRTGERRVIGVDVTRGLALFGVVVMNFHGYLNVDNSETSGQPGAPFVDRLFDTTHGVLTTRFAAAFVLMAGMGVTLLTNRSRLSADPGAIQRDRWRLVRRGLVLYVGGFALDQWWPGTIIFYYGAYFTVSALLFTLRARWLIAIAIGSAVAAASIEFWRSQRAVDGHDTSWLDPPGRTARGLLLRTFVGASHPLLPWLAFLCVGMVLARYLPRLNELRWRWAALGAVLLAGSYAISHVASGGGLVRQTEFSTQPLKRGLLYTSGALGSAMVAFCVISWVAELGAGTWLVQALQRIGQMTLTVYVVHVVVFKVLVDWTGLIRPTGLDTALGFSAAFLVVAIPLTTLWHRFFGQGPLERVYRLIAR